MLTEDQICAAFHTSIRALQIAAGEDKPAPPWSQAEDWQRDSTKKAVRSALAGEVVSARAEHERWMAERLAAGWTYGRDRDDAAKKNPNLVPFDELSVAERAKDALLLELATLAA